MLSCCGLLDCRRKAAEFFGRGVRQQAQADASRGVPREMECAVPWPALEALIEPHYPKTGGGRPPYALSAMLRIHCLQQGYGLSDPAMEEIAAKRW